MKIYVLTNGVRTLHNTYNQIDYILYMDKSNNPHKCYIDLLDIARKSNDDVLILEDDLILCKDFISRITPIINQYKDNIINFFWEPLRNVKNITIEKKGFCYTQCVYYPKSFIEKFYRDLQNPTFSYAENIAQALEKNDLQFVNVRPHYVQHIGDDSLIWKGLCVRKSKMFVDDLNK